LRWKMAESRLESLINRLEKVVQKLDG